MYWNLEAKVGGRNNTFKADTSQHICGIQYSALCKDWNEDLKSVWNGKKYLTLKIIRIIPSIIRLYEIFKIFKSYILKATFMNIFKMV